jgi:hypothetical protein
VGLEDLEGRWISSSNEGLPWLLGLARPHSPELSINDPFRDKLILSSVSGVYSFPTNFISKQAVPGQSNMFSFLINALRDRIV